MNSEIIDTLQLTDWGRQMVRQVRRWLPTRAIVVVAFFSFAALELLWALCQMSKPVHIITRLRERCSTVSTLPRFAVPNKWDPERKVGKRLPGSKALVSNPYTPWQTFEMKDWYGQGDYPLHITKSDRSLVQNWDASRAYSRSS